MTMHIHVDSISKWTKDTKRRFEPREFQYGHWHPCCFEGREFVCKFNGKMLEEPVNANSAVSSISWSTDKQGLIIGESLGKIEF